MCAMFRYLPNASTWNLAAAFWLAAALMGFMPFAALLLDARVGTFPSVRPHLPFSETSTSIDFRRGTGPCFGRCVVAAKRLRASYLLAGQA